MTKSNMSVEDVLSDLVATAFCKGQDWKKGDGGATSLDKDTAKALDQLYQLLESCKPEERVATMVIGCPYCHRNFPTNEEEYNVGVNEYHSNIRKLFE